MCLHCAILIISHSQPSPTTKQAPLLKQDSFKSLGFNEWDVNGSIWSSSDCTVILRNKRKNEGIPYSASPFSTCSNSEGGIRIE